MMDGFMGGANMGDPGDVGGPVGGEYEVMQPDSYVPETAHVQGQPQYDPNAQQPLAAAPVPAQPGNRSTLVLGGLCAAAGLFVGMMIKDAMRK